MSWKLIAWLAISCLLAMPSEPARPQDKLISDAAAKAAMIYQFGKFTEWPGQGKSEHFRICMAGEQGALAQALGTLTGKAVHGLALEVRQLGRHDDTAACHVLVIAEPPARSAEWLAEVRNKPVLTIGDTPGFVDSGGMIGFVTEGDRLRFDVDADLIERSRLKLNASVVRLARNYRGGR